MAAANCNIGPLQQTSLGSELAPIARLGLLAPINTEVRIWLARLLGRSQRVVSGSRLTKDDSSTAGAIFILDGWASRPRILSDGRRQILQFGLARRYNGCRSRLQADGSHYRTLADDVCLFHSIRNATCIRKVGCLAGKKREVGQRPSIESDCPIGSYDRLRAHRSSLFKSCAIVWHSLDAHRASVFRCL